MATIQKKDYLIYKNASGKLERSPVIIENLEIVKGQTGKISILDPNTDKILGSIDYGSATINNEKALKFEALVSHIEGKGVGTKLILELINISRKIGANGILIAEPGPFSGSQISRPLTNIPFYYKLGFQAINPDRHNAIKKLLEEKKDIPLGLNINAYIKLSKEAATKLEQKAIALQQDFEKQNATNTSGAKQFKKATDDLSKKMVSKTVKAKQNKQNQGKNR